MPVPPRRLAAAWLPPLLLFCVAAAVRFPHLSRHGYDLDEAWAAEVAVGRGSPHASPPVGVVTDPAPHWCDLAGAPPPWHVWTHLAATHPPAYSVLLRLWEHLIGTGDADERALSAVASTLAVLVLYDAVRVRSGRGPAFWAGLLMAVASPQVEYARLTRNYALLTLAAVALADAVARVEAYGPTRRRTVGVAAATAAVLLTHYFGFGVVAAVAAYAVAYLRPPARRSTVLAVTIGVAVFAVAWLPMVFGQRSLLSGDDPATDFLRHDLPDHLWQTAVRVAVAPLSMLFEPRTTAVPYAAAGAVLYVLPLAVAGRRGGGLAFWGLWLCATVGQLAALDLARGTTHLHFVRYVLPAGPAVFALVPTTLSAAARRLRPGWGWVAHAVPAAAALAAVAALPDVYRTWRADPAEMVAALAPPLSSADLLVLAGPPRQLQFVGGQYLLLDRYLGPVPCPVVFLTAPADATVRARLRTCRRAWLFTSDEAGPTPYLPGVPTVAHARSFPGYGTLYPLGRP